MGGHGFRLFRFAGIDVYVHFTWFLVAIYWITSLTGRYEQKIWALYEYLALFLIVLAHEFGHALACRSTGGVANRIMLWPLGGVAFVQPPPRPGAVLWSIAAGPLVNVALVPIFEAINLAVHMGQIGLSADAMQFLWTLRFINIALLIFNLLPIYPLDGGQILRALLWFPLGQIRSLQIASAVGLVGAGGLGLVAILQGRIWLGIIALFVFTQAFSGWQHARALRTEPQLAREMPVEPEVRR